MQNIVYRAGIVQGKKYIGRIQGGQYIGRIAYREDGIQGGQYIEKMLNRGDSIYGDWYKVRMLYREDGIQGGQYTWRIVYMEDSIYGGQYIAQMTIFTFCLGGHCPPQGRTGKKCLPLGRTDFLNVLPRGGHLKVLQGVHSQH